MLVSAQQVAGAVQLLLRTQLPGRLSQVGTLTGRVLALPVTWERQGDFAQLPEQRTPAVYCVVNNVEVVNTDELGEADLGVTVQVFVVVTGRDSASVHDSLADYVAAVRYSLLADLSLDEVAWDGAWLGEQFGELSADQQRTTAAGFCRVRYMITVPTTLGALPPTTSPPTAVWPHPVDPGATIPEDVAVTSITVDLHQPIE